MPQVMPFLCLLVLLLLYYSRHMILADWPIFGVMCRGWDINMMMETHPEKPITPERACPPFDLAFREIEGCESQASKQRDVLLGTSSIAEMATDAAPLVFQPMERESEFGTPGEREPQSSTPDTEGLVNEFASSGGNFSQNLGIFPKHTNEGAASPALPVELRNEFDTPGEVYSQHLDDVAVSPVPRLVLVNQFDTPGG